MAKAQTSEANSTGSLMDFQFDNDLEFFGVKATVDTDGQQVIKEVKEEKIVDDDDAPDEGVTTLDDGEAKKGKPKGEGEEEEEEDVTFFDQNNEEEEEETTELDEEKPKKETPGKKKDEKEPEEVDDKQFFTTLVNEMKEKGIFQNIEVKENEEITEEKFLELQDAEIEARVNETFEAFAEEMDEDGKAFIKFKKDGGKTSDFFHIYSNRSFDIDQFDEDNEAHVNKVLKHYLTQVEKLDESDMNDRLEWLKEGGKEKAYAKKYFGIIENDRKTLKEKITKAQAEAAKEREDALKEFQTSFTEVLSKTESVGAFAITKTDQKELTSYVIKPTVKVGKNKYIPQFQKDIANIFKAETEEDKKKLLLLAKLVKTGFDVKDLVTQVETEVTKKAKSKLADAKRNIKPSSSGSAGKKSISDYFN